MKKSIKLLTIIFTIMTINLIIGCTNIKGANKITQAGTVYFNKGVYRTESPDSKNIYKNYFYVFYDETSGHTENSKQGIGLPFSCIQKEDYVKFKFGGVGEPEEIFKIKSQEKGVITGYFENGSLFKFIPVTNANSDNFDATKYVK